MKYLIYLFLAVMLGLSCEKSDTKSIESHITDSLNLQTQNPDTSITDSLDLDTIWMTYNDYIPFPEKNAEWITTTYENIYINGKQDDNQPPNQQILYNNRYYYNGDTFINNLRYIKVFKDYSFLHYTVDTYEPPWIGIILDEGDSTLLYGSFRQDIDSKKVYFIFDGTTNEELLFDFSLQVNDTVINYSNDRHLFTVYCIFSTLIKNRNHEVIYYKVESRDGTGSAVLNSLIIIEGIGNYRSGPFSRNDVFKEFRYNGENYYTWNSSICCLTCN